MEKKKNRWGLFCEPVVGRINPSSLTRPIGFERRVRWTIRLRNPRHTWGVAVSPQKRVLLKSRLFQPDVAGEKRGKGAFALRKGKKKGVRLRGKKRRIDKVETGCNSGAAAVTSGAGWLGGRVSNRKREAGNRADVIPAFKVPERKGNGSTPNAGGSRQGRLKDYRTAIRRFGKRKAAAPTKKGLS